MVPESRVRSQQGSSGQHLTGWQKTVQGQMLLLRLSLLPLLRLVSKIAVAAEIQHDIDL